MRGSAAHKEGSVAAPVGDNDNGAEKDKGGAGVPLYDYQK